MVSQTESNDAIYGALIVQSWIELKSVTLPLGLNPNHSRQRSLDTTSQCGVLIIADPALMTGAPGDPMNVNPSVEI